MPTRPSDPAATQIRRRVSRRAILRGVAGAAITLPRLEALTESRASENAIAERRLAYFYIPNGVPPEAWQPESVGGDNRIRRLNRWMSSLEPYRDALTIFRDLWTPRGNGHIAGTATWLTGGGFDGARLDVGGASADQIAANHFRSTTILPSLEISSRGEGFFSSNLPRNSISWRDSRTPVPREVEPRAIFDRMFHGSSSRLARKSVLDLVKEDAERISRQISVADRRTVDQYLQSIRELERRMEFSRKPGNKPHHSEKFSNSLRRPDFGIPDDHERYVRSLMDLIVLAFWSDSTRVCSFMLDHGQSNRYFNFIEGVTGTWHALSHWKSINGKTEDDDGKTSWESREQKLLMYNRVTQWHTRQVGYFLGRLDEIELGGKSLLDQSMVVYGSSLADGHEHEAKNLPVLVAGRGGGSIRSGRLVTGARFGRGRELSMSSLHLALLHRMGIQRERFAESDSPLAL